MSKTEKLLDETVSQILKGEVTCEVLKNIVGDGKYKVHYALFAFKKLVASITDSKLSKEIELAVNESLNMLLDVTDSHHQLTYVLYQTIETEKRQEIIKKFVQICKLRVEPSTDNFQIYLIITEEFLRNLFQDTIKAEHWNVIKGNYQFIMSAAFEDSNLLLKVFQSFHRQFPRKLKTPDHITKIVELLEETLLTAIPKIEFQLEDDDLVLSYITFMEFISYYSRYNAKIIEVFEKITAAFLKQNCFEIQPEYKYCIDVLNICYKYFNDSDTNNETHLTQLFTKFYTISSKKTYTLPFIKTTVIVARILVFKLKDQQITKQFATVFLNLTYSLLSILRCLNKEPKNLLCLKCGDMKRHESIALLNSMLIIYTKLIKTLDITNSVAIKIVQNIKYRLELCDDLKCTSKDAIVQTTLNYLTNIICAFARNKELVASNYSSLNDVMQLIFHYQHKYNIQTVDCFNFAWAIYSITQEDDSNIQQQLAGLGSLIYFLKKTTNEELDVDDAMKKRLGKTFWYTGVLTKKLKFSCIADYLSSKQFCNLKFVDESEMITRDELLLLEMKSIYRYSTTPSDDENLKLFDIIFEDVKDPSILAQSLQLFNDSTLKKVDTKKIMKIKKTLLAVVDKSGEIKAALGFINYHQYWKKTQEMNELIHPLIDKAVVESSIDQLNLVADKLLIDDELKTIEYLNEALKMFSEVYKDKSVNKLASIRKTSKILENIANQFIVRNIIFKAIEAFTVMYQYCCIENHNIGFLNIALFFMDYKNLVTDNDGKVICVSEYFPTPTTCDLVEKVNVFVSETVFVEQNVNLQSYILTYLLSLASYQITSGNEKGLNHLKMFQSLYKDWNVDVSSGYKCKIKSKLFLVLHELSLLCNNSNAEHLLLNAILTILDVKKVDTDFYTQIQIYYERLTMKSIDYYMNRHSNFEHINKLLATLQNLASRYGHCIKLMKIFSINTMRKLNMEKIDDVKSNLQVLKKLMGLKDEILVANTGYKKSEVLTMLPFDLETQARKSAAVSHSSPVQQYEFNSSPNYSNEMLQQLKKYVHEANCSCKICKLPQLKLFLFQIGCFYSRLLWLMEKYEICQDFNELAMKQWLKVNKAVEKNKFYGYLAVDKDSFKLFSIRWIIHNSDVSIRLKDYKMAAYYYQQARELATDDLFDVKSIQQYLFCREENLKGLQMSQGSPRDIVRKFRFSEFIRIKQKDKKVVVKPSATFSDVIYIDSCDDNEEIAVTKEVIMKKVEKKASVKVRTAAKDVSKSIEKTIQLTTKLKTSSTMTTKLKTSSTMTTKLTDNIKTNNVAIPEKSVKISSRSKTAAPKLVTKVPDKVVPVKVIKFSSIAPPPKKKEPIQLETTLLKPSVKTITEEVPKIIVKTVKEKNSDKAKTTVRSTRTRQQT